MNHEKCVENEVKSCLLKHSHYDMARAKEIFREKTVVWILRCKNKVSLLGVDSLWSLGGFHIPADWGS